METTSRLFRTPHQAVLGGVCNGLAQYFKIDVTIVRVAFAVGTLATHGPFGFIYLILWVALPKNDASFIEFNQNTTTDSQPLTSNSFDMKKQKNRFLGGIILILIGVLFLFEELDIIWWADFDHLWPLILVAVGGYLIFKDKIDPDGDRSEY
jgi:phage shock protein PspC (stress-responsive transcriptional regulator)